jgi:uncharacterized protein
MSDASGFREKIKAYIAQEALPVEKFGHQPRLYELTREAGAGLHYDDDVVFAASWLHDIGVFTGHRPEDPAKLATWDNVAYAMERTPSILRSMGFPEEKIEAVVETIRTHQPAAEPTSIEGIILRDADILEQLGAIGILRTVCKIGRDTRLSTFTAAVDSLRNAVTQLPGRLQLETSRALARLKTELLESFLKSVDLEAKDNLH